MTQPLVVRDCPLATRTILPVTGDSVLLRPVRPVLTAPMPRRTTTHPSPNRLVHHLVKLLPAAFVIGGVTAASAATLGITPDEVAGGGIEVTGCDSSVTVDYLTEYDPTTGVYQVTDAVIGDIDATACAGHTLDVVVATDAFVELADGTATVATASHTIELSTPVDAAEVDHIAIVFTG